MAKSSDPTNHSGNPFEENPTLQRIIDWFLNNKQFLAWTLVGLFGIIVALSRSFIMHTSQAEADFVRAQTLFTKFQTEGIKDSPQAESDLKEFLVIMERHPELRPKYQGEIAQTLLISGQTLKADPFIQDLLKRTKADHLPFYHQFSESTLLIDKGQFADALAASEKLNTLLEKDDAKKAAPTLYLFNLLRLAILNQFLGHQEGELKAWNIFAAQQGKEVLFAESVLGVGQSKLSDYVKERQNKLNETEKKSI